MKRLTEEEFRDHIEREVAIQRAREIFIKSDITKNITVAFEMYQAILAEQEREINIVHPNDKPVSIFDTLPRPKCDLCGSDMLIRFLPPNTEKITSQTICSNCDNVLDFDLTPDQWVDLLKEQDGSD
jgi:hypothetical protein